MPSGFGNGEIPSVKIDERRSVHWFQIHEVDWGVYALVEPGHVQSFLVKGGALSVLIDTGMGFSDIREAASRLVDREIVVFNTHWHYDHTGGNRLFDQVGISEIEAPLLEKTIPNRVLMDRYLKPCLKEGIPFPEGFIPETYEAKGSRATFHIAEGDRFDLGGRVLEAVATPGHTHGGMSFIDDLTGGLFCGDFVYRGSLYAHLNESDMEEYVESIQKLVRRYHDIRVLFPAHNDHTAPKIYLKTVLEGFQKIHAGAAPFSTGYGREKDVLVYSFGEFNILTRARGSGGVDILGSNP